MYETLFSQFKIEIMFIDCIIKILCFYVVKPDINKITFNEK